MTRERKRVKAEPDRDLRKTLERWVLRDRRCRTLHRAVRDAERDLRRAVSKDAWELYLVLEEHINARHVEIVAAAIKLTRAARARRGGGSGA